MKTSPFVIHPFNAGECKLGQNHVLGDPHSDEDRISFTLYSFLADGGPGRRVLIDLGPIGLTYLNDMFRRFHFFRDLPGDPDAIRQPHGNIFDWLQRLHLKPSDIDHIVFTHMHADHHGLNDAKDGGGAERFPRARIHVSKIGWQDNLDKRKDGQWNSYVDYAFGDYLLKEEKKGRVIFHDDVDIVEGLDVFYLGGHAVCSQGIRMKTAEGDAIVASDEIYHYTLWEQGILARLHTTPQKLRETNDKLADLALAGAVVLPCHDPALSDLYREVGDGWLKRVRPLSDKAAKGWKAADKKSLPGTKRAGI